MPESRSFHFVEIFVEPGGMRYCFWGVTPDREAVRRFLSWWMSSGSGTAAAYALCVYGLRAFVSVYEEGRRTARVDVLPFMTVSIPELAEVRFAPLPEGEIGRGPDSVPRMRGLALLKRGDFHDGDPEAAARVEERALGDRLFDDPDIRIDLDWDALAATLPPLAGTLVRPGETVTVDSLYVGKSKTADCGFTETESGYFVADPSDFETVQ